MKGIVAPEIGPKSFATFEEQAPGPTQQGIMSSKDMYGLWASYKHVRTRASKVCMLVFQDSRFQS